DAGLARQQDDAALALLYLLPAPQQQLELLLAAYHRSEGPSAASQGFEAAFDLALAQHTPGADWPREPLQRHTADVFIVEQRANQPAGRFRDQHAIRLGRGLQPRREIRSIANNAAFLGLARPDQIAHDD